MPRWTKTLAERFWDKVDTSGECWVWTGVAFMTHSGAYGQMWVNEFRQKRAAHRISWFLVHGEWPDGVLDHTCRNTLCVRPEHLRLTDHAGNIAVGSSPSAVAHRTGVCARGHTDWYLIKATGKLRCRTCERIRQRAWRATRRQAAV